MQYASFRKGRGENTSPNGLGGLGAGFRYPDYLLSPQKNDRQRGSAAFLSIEPSAFPRLRALPKSFLGGLGDSAAAVLPEVKAEGSPSSLEPSLPPISYDSTSAPLPANNTGCCLPVRPCGLVWAPPYAIEPRPPVAPDRPKVPVDDNPKYATPGPDDGQVPNLPAMVDTPNSIAYGGKTVVAVAAGQGGSGGAGGAGGGGGGAGGAGADAGDVYDVPDGAPSALSLQPETVDALVGASSFADVSADQVIPIATPATMSGTAKLAIGATVGFLLIKWLGGSR